LKIALSANTQTVWMFARLTVFMKVPECPIGAIFADDDVPEGQEHFTELNAELSLEWPVINVSKESPDDATEWEGKPDKLKLLER